MGATGAPAAPNWSAAGRSVRGKTSDTGRTAPAATAATASRIIRIRAGPLRANRNGSALDFLASAPMLLGELSIVAGEVLAAPVGLHGGILTGQAGAFMAGVTLVLPVVDTRYTNEAAGVAERCENRLRPLPTAAEICKLIVSSHVSFASGSVDSSCLCSLKQCKTVSIGQVPSPNQNIMESSTLVLLDGNQGEYEITTTCSRANIRERARKGLIGTPHAPQ